MLNTMQKCLKNKLWSSSDPHLSFKVVKFTLLMITQMPRGIRSILYWETWNKAHIHTSVVQNILECNIYINLNIWASNIDVTSCTGESKMAWSFNVGKLSKILSFLKRSMKLRQVSSPFPMSLSSRLMTLLCLSEISVRFMYSRWVIRLAWCTCCKMNSASTDKVSMRKTLYLTILWRDFLSILQNSHWWTGEEKNIDVSLCQSVQ